MNAATATQIDTPEEKKFRSDRQRRMYEFILKFRDETGFSPSIREIGENTAIPSTSVVNYNLQQMIKDGWIRQAGFGKSRGYIPCEDAPRATLQALPPSSSADLLHVEEIIRTARAMIRRLEKERYYCSEMIGLAAAVRAYEGGKK